MTEPKIIGGLQVEEEPAELRGRTFMFYGPFGGGKTRLAATATLLGKTFWIITDANTDGILMQFPSDMIDMVHINRFIPAKEPFRNERKIVQKDEDDKIIYVDTMKINPDAFQQYVDVLNDLVAHKFYDFDFIVIDSLTTIGDMCMDMILIKNNKIPLEASPEIQHYGKQVRHLMGQCGQLVQEGAKYSLKYAIVIAHDKVNEDKKLGVISITPSLTGQAGRTIGKEYEEVYYLTPTTGGKKAGWQARTRGIGIILARTQLSNLPDVIPQGDMTMKWLIEQREVFVSGLKRAG